MAAGSRSTNTDMPAATEERPGTESGRLLNPRHSADMAPI
jgi:hypothetical protein